MMNKKLDKKTVVKFFFILIFTFYFNFNFSYAAENKSKEEKDCIYCKKFETLADWPENERPDAFIYEDIKYPKKMFHETMTTSRLRQKEAGRMVYKRFVKAKSSLNKYQHLMIRDMAYFEALFNEMLSDKKTKVETLEGIKKGREAMRMSLNISPKAKSSEAVLKFWATGKMLKAAYKKNKKKRRKKLKLIQRFQKELLYLQI